MDHLSNSLCIRMRRSHVLVASAVLACTLLFPAPSRADHAPIAIDGLLGDLISVIASNSGPTQGGFSMPGLFGEIYTQSCQFVNGFDVEHYYLFIDYRDGASNPTNSIRLYAGWETFGRIGDVDGDGNPDFFSNPQGGCAVTDQPGIGSLESYAIDFDFDCDGSNDLSLAITDNGVFQTSPSLVDLSGQSSFASADSTLELRIDDIQNLVPAGLDLCRARIRLSANADLDGLGEDRSTTVQLDLEQSIEISKQPGSQAACPGDIVVWSIEVTNPGPCTLESVSLLDTLDAGMSYDSSIPVRTSGNAQVSLWNLGNLAPGETRNITLRAMLGGSCSGSLFNHASVFASHGAVACSVRVVSGSTIATVDCGAPLCTIDVSRPGAACLGESIDLCGPTGPYLYSWTLPGGGGASTRCINVASVSFADTGLYTLEITDFTTGCTSSCSYELIAVPPPPCSIEATPSGPVCFGSDVSLCGPAGPYAYAWVGPDSLFASTRCLNLVSLNPSQVGTYSLVVTDTTNGCESDPCFYEFVGVAPPPCDIAGPTSICGGESLELCGPTGNYLYAWTLPDSSTATTRCIFVSNPISGPYMLTVTDAATGCESTCVHVVSVDSPPVCTISGPTAVCVGDSLTLCGPFGNYAYQWFLPDGSTDTTACIDVGAAQPIDAGTYTLVVTDLASGCQSVPCQTTVQVLDSTIAAVSIGDVLALEGSGGTTQFVFDVTLTNPMCRFARVDFATQGGTATTFGNDFTPTSGSLDFLPGETTQQVTVEVTADFSNEPNEFFFVLLSNAIGCSLGDYSGVGTIENDDGTISAIDAPVTEFALGAIRPNPSRGGAVAVDFSAPREAFVRLTVHDLQGRSVAVLGEGVYPPGRHQVHWDGRSRGARPAAGVYFVRYQTPAGDFVRRLAVTR